MAYVLERGVVANLGPHVAGLGGRCVVLHDRHATPELLRRVASGLRAGGPGDVTTLRLDSPACTKDAARALAARITETGADVVVALGGSKVLDLARAAMRPLQPRRPALALVPSIVSSNSCVGSLAVMYGDDHRVNGFWSLDRAPELVVVDLDFVVDGSPRFLASAIGDQAASSLEALHDGRGDKAGLAAHAVALDALLAGGRAAMGAVRAHEVTPLLEMVVRAVTHYTPEQEAAAGVVVCHALGEALSADPDVAGRMHGEVVGACVAAELVAAGEREAVAEWAGLFHDIGLSATLSELGVRDMGPQRALALCEAALAGMMGQGSARAWTPADMAGAVLEAESLLA